MRGRRAALAKKKTGYDFKEEKVVQHNTSRKSAQVGLD